MYKLHSKMELWADDSESQFAIIADSQVLAKTDESIFTKKLDSTSFSSRHTYDWESVIKRWIYFYFSKRYGGRFIEEGMSPQTEFIPTNTTMSRPRLRIKCTFCGLKFETDFDRDEHEMAWHPNKLKNKQ
jgi:hypothetical protein